MPFAHKLVLLTGAIVCLLFFLHSHDSGSDQKEQREPKTNETDEEQQGPRVEDEQCHKDDDDEASQCEVIAVEDEQGPKNDDKKSSQNECAVAIQDDEGGQKDSNVEDEEPVVATADDLDQQDPNKTKEEKATQCEEVSTEDDEDQQGPNALNEERNHFTCEQEKLEHTIDYNNEAGPICCALKEGTYEDFAASQATRKSADEAFDKFVRLDFNECMVQFECQLTRDFEKETNEIESKNILSSQSSHKSIHASAEESDSITPTENSAKDEQKPQHEHECLLNMDMKLNLDVKYRKGKNGLELNRNRLKGDKINEKGPNQITSPKSIDAGGESVSTTPTENLSDDEQKRIDFCIAITQDQPENEFISKKAFKTVITTINSRFQATQLRRVAEARVFRNALRALNLKINNLTMPKILVKRASFFKNKKIKKIKLALEDDVMEYSDAINDCQDIQMSIF